MTNTVLRELLLHRKQIKHDIGTAAIGATRKGHNAEAAFRATVNRPSRGAKPLSVQLAEVEGKIRLVPGGAEWLQREERQLNRLAFAVTGWFFGFLLLVNLGNPLRLTQFQALALLFAGPVVVANVIRPTRIP